ncbi:MAG TPA: RNB domain-containing ribonuclease [Pyrinomonadaceae bacterium]|nr:RNB domain-containing ribonuclease [Pyrinomonadaceae bacterium]
MTQNKNHSSDLNLLEIARNTMIHEGFEPDFPPTAMAEVAKLNGDSPHASPTVRDLRGLLWSSIDNVESKDLDQVEYVEQNGDQIKVFIGIADVDSYVAKGSAVDLHAFENTTSVYTGVRTFPMLPEKLSTDVTSLVQDQDRLAVIIEFGVPQDGQVVPREVYAALVRNKAKLSYDSVGKWLDNNGTIPEPITKIAQLEDQIKLQAEAARRLLATRRANGALELETIQTTPVMDENGSVVDLSVTEQNSARDIIENFMIAANVSMSDYLGTHGVTSLQRIVRTPENWPRIVEMADELHESLPGEPDARALAEFLERRRKLDPDHFPDLSLAVVKLLGPGEYVAQRPEDRGEGHFGLAVHNYIHSTAPNRRYADLITQRLLKSSQSSNNTPYSFSELEQIADHCNERESAARKVERKMRKVAAAVLLKNRIGEEFDSIVTGVTPKGTFVRTIKPPVDGLVVRGKEGLKVGQHARVRLQSTDPANGFIDFAVVRHA